MQIGVNDILGGKSQRTPSLVYIVAKITASEIRDKRTDDAHDRHQCWVDRASRSCH